MSEELRIALVGCGKISQKYAELLPTLAAQCRLTAVCDLNPARAAEFGSRYGVPFFSSIADMMEHFGSGVDVFAVLTPSGAHAENVCELAELGAANIIVEKPIALSLEDAQRVIDVCELHQSRLFVVKQWRYSRAVELLRGAFVRGRFGTVSLLTARLRWCRHQQYYEEARWRGTWAQDGGVLTNQAVHAIDLLSWFGGEVDTVFAMCETRLAKIEAEDTAVAVIRFADGKLGALEATTAVRPRNLEASFSLLGSEGSAEVGGGSCNQIQTWCFERPELEDAEIVQASSASPFDGPQYAHAAYLREVFSCVREGRNGGVSGEEALRSLRIIHALYQSEQLGLPVELKSNDFAFSRLGRKAYRGEEVTA